MLATIDTILTKLQDKDWFYKQILGTSLFDILEKHANYAVQAYKNGDWSSPTISMSGDSTMLCNKLYLTQEIAALEYSKYKPYIKTAKQKDQNDGITYGDDEIALWIYDRGYKHRIENDLEWIEL